MHEEVEVSPALQKMFDDLDTDRSGTIDIQVRENTLSCVCRQQPASFGWADCVHTRFS